MSQEINNPTAETPRQRRHAWIWIMLMVNIVFLLVLMSLGIIALRVGNYLPETDIVFIAGKNTDVSVGDSENSSWKTEEEIKIFDSGYLNDNGDLTVNSDDGQSLIAPGTEMTYGFTMYNNSNVAVYYEVDLDLIVKIGKLPQGREMEERIPVQVKLETASGDYLIGSETSFVSLSDALVNVKRRALGAESFETFTLHLKWDYEGDDANDTALGDISAEEDLSLNLSVEAYAEEHPDPAAKGGTSIDAEKETEIGGSVRWVWVLLLMINTAVLIFYVSWLMNKRLQKW